MIVCSKEQCEMKSVFVRAVLVLIVLILAAAPVSAEQPVARGHKASAAEAKPAEAKPPEAKPAETKPPEAKASDVKPPEGSGPGVKLTWKAPQDVAAAKVAGYNVYRSESILGHYERVNPRPLKDLAYEDRGGLVKGKSYYYKVTTLLADGKESNPTSPVGMAAGAEPGTQANRLPGIKFFTSDALGRITYQDENAVFVLEGDPGLKCSFDIEGVASGIPMDETKPGTYTGVYKVPSGTKVKDATATATVYDNAGGTAMARTQPALDFLGVMKPTLGGLYAGILEPDRVGLNWPRQEGLDGYYSLYRDTSRILGPDGLNLISGNMNGGITAFIDTGVNPGDTYYYVLAVINPRDGSVKAFSENLVVKVPMAVKASGIESVDEDSGGRELKPGDTLTVTVKTAPGGKAFFTLGIAVRDQEITESSPGVYKGSHVFREGDGVFKSRVAVGFKDKSGASNFSNSATFVSVNAPRGTLTGNGGGKKPAVSTVTDDIRTVAGISGRLTAGKTFTVTITGEPGNSAFFSVGDGIWKVPMKEQPGSPGTYTGEYTVRPGDSAGMSPDPLKAVYVTGYLMSPSGAVSDPVSDPAPVQVDTTCDIKVAVSSGSLPADARSQSRVTFTVADADGEPVADRRLSILLEPPPRYTGVVGVGGMAPLTSETGLSAQSDIGRLQVDFDNLTDRQGTVTATYTAGFAAKTAMIVARDFLTGSVGMAYVTSSISSSVNVTLQPATPGGQVVTAPSTPIYQLQIEAVPDPGNPVSIYPGFAVEAVPDTLTADGVSRANIIATLTKDGVPVEGKSIVFAVSGAGGSLTRSSAVTDISGRAQVFYIAGTKAGKALVTATEPTTGVSATKVITLLADAPARIYAKAYPDTLPADGVSTSRIVVELADVNNNPTDGVNVSFALGGGRGMGAISLSGAVTDVRGACDFIYTSGTQAGVATIDIAARSEAPTDEQMKEAGLMVVAPLVYDNYDFTELVVRKWFKSVGDLVGKGEPLALVGTPLGDMVVYSPAAGTLDRVVVDQGVNVMEGKEIGILR